MTSELFPCNEAVHSPSLDHGMSPPKKKQRLLQTSLFDTAKPSSSPAAPSKVSGVSGPSSLAEETVVGEALPRLTEAAAAEFARRVAGEGSADLGDQAFNPAVIPREKWAFYSVKGDAKSFDESRMLFEPLATAWSTVEGIKHSGMGSKKKAITVLTNAFRLILLHCPHELPFALYLSLHKVCPDYFGVEIGVGESILIKTVAETYGRKEASVKSELQKTGDLGLTAESFKVVTKTLFTPARLSLKSLFEDFSHIAEAKGHQAQTRKREIVKRLLVAAVKQEPRFVVRFLQQNLRIGIQTASVLDALAFASILSPPEVSIHVDAAVCHDALHLGITPGFTAACKAIKCTADVRHASSHTHPVDLPSLMDDRAAAVRQAYSQVPNLAHLAYLLLCGLNSDQLRDACVITPGVPVFSMLAKPTKGIAAVLDAMSGCTFLAEYKYDGERLQIHKMPDGKVHLFSRNQETLDMKYPEILSVLQEATQEGVTDYILDSEVVAYDPRREQLLPFQTLATRKRKDVDIATLEVAVCVFIFDCLRLNGESLCTHSLRERRQKLQAAIKEVPGRLQFAKGSTIDEVSELEILLQDAIDNQTEGLMVKALEGPKSVYEPSKRSVNWLKLKKDYLDTLGDSVDLVPIGAFWGRGKRSGVYGAFLLAVYDPDDECYRSACKVATGFSEADLAAHFEFFKDKILQRKPVYYHISDRLAPEVWLEAAQVWECKAADLQVSPVHTSGWEAVARGKGIGLRFPRFLRIRVDKKPEQATDSNQIIEMYEAQFKNNQNQPAATDDADDFIL